VALSYYYFGFHGQTEERKAQVARVWTIRDGRTSFAAMSSIIGTIPLAAPFSNSSNAITSNRTRGLGLEDQRHRSLSSGGLGQ
jgi:hypothetical protein